MKYYHLVGTSLFLAIVQWGMQQFALDSRVSNYFFLSLQTILLGLYSFLVIGYFFLVHTNEEEEEVLEVESTPVQPISTSRQAARFLEKKAS